MKSDLTLLAVLSLLTALPPRAAELEVRSFSGKVPVADPVAVAVDDRGVVYVTQTERRKTADLDIRQFGPWVEDDIHLTNIEQKRAFLRAALPEGQHTAKSGDLKDWNQDKRVDWHDLTVPTERIWRLEDTDGDGVADRRAVAAEGFNTEVTGIAAGIAAIQGSLYLTCAPDFWKLDDADGDGVFEKRASLVHGFGHHIAYAGHDMHGPRLHPDGRVYWTIGDKGVSAADREGKRRDYPHQGALLRCEPDGSRFEVFAHGLRNPQEIAFDENGDFFAVDNDADHPGDRERFLHVIEGADYGWRNHYQYRRGEYFVWMEEEVFSPRTARQPAYFIPAIRSYSDGPAGFVYNPGTALGKGFENTFILGEFPSGKITAFRVEPDGAGFRMTGDRLVSAGTTAVGFNWGPDGALYAADWEAGYELNHIGAVKVFDVPDPIRDSRRVDTRRLLAEGMAKRAETELRDLLGHPDQRVRMRGQFALVARGADAILTGVALDTQSPPLARRHALWGAGQLARTRGLPASVDAVRALMSDTDALLAGLAFTVVSETRGRAATDDDVRVWTAALTSPAPRLRLRAAEALLRAAKPEAVEPLIAFLRANQDQDVYLRNAGFRALAACADEARLMALARDEAPAVRRAAVLALRERADPGLAVFLADADASIATEAARAIHDLPVTGGLPALAAQLARLDGLAPEALVRRALSANYRLGDQAALARVIAFASTTRPGELRDPTLNALVRWLKPGRTCLVDDSPVTLPARDNPALTATLRAAWPSLAKLSSKRLPDLRKAYGIALDLPATLATLRDETAPEADRALACEALASDPNAAKTLRTEAPALLARDGTPPLLRLRLAEALGRGQPETAVKTLSALVANAPVSVAQSAVSALAEVQHATSDAALLALAATPRDELVLELHEALLARKKALKGAEKAAKALPVDPYRVSQKGGDAARGREVVFTHADAGCVRCHSIGSEGLATVGPNLAGSGSRHDARALLESMLDPAAKVSPGFALTSVTTRDGGTVAGWWMAETATTLTLKTPEGETKTLEKSTIASQTPPLSTMPPMGTLLTPRELRDVVAYLQTLK